MSANTKNCCVICLGYTPNNAVSIGSILKHFGSQRIYCFLSTDRSYAKYRKDVSWLGLSSETFLFKAFSFLMAGLQIRYLLYRYQDVAICLPHPDHLLGNFLFFHPRVSRRFIYEDGLLNYYDAVPSKKVRKRMRARHRFGWLFGLPYRLYTGLLSGVDEQFYDGAFLCFPAKAVKKDRLGELIEIVRYKNDKECANLNDTVLFLDQDIETLVSPEAATALRRAMTNLLADLNGTVIYKPHYDITEQTVQLSSYEALPGGMCAQPAELLITQLRPKAVVSFVSSALINIKSICPEIRCISVGSNEVQVFIECEETSLDTLFESFGVEVVSV